MKWLLVALTLLLAGCGTTVSSEPIYPAGWPALAKDRDAKACPDISGTYRAVSEPVGPMVYPKGGAPHEMFFFVPISGDLVPPKVARRVLPWQLAVTPSDEVRKSLIRFDEALGADDAHPEGKVDLGWVRIGKADGGKFSIQCGMDDKVQVSFMLEPAPRQSLWEWMWINPRGYMVDDGVLVTYCMTNSLGVRHGTSSTSTDTNYETAAGRFEFHLAADGSLVMLEDLFAERFYPGGGSMVFQKWWRWRRIGG